MNKKFLFEIGIRLDDGKYLRIASDLSLQQSTRLKADLAEHCTLVIKFQCVKEINDGHEPSFATKGKTPRLLRATS